MEKIQRNTYFFEEASYTLRNSSLRSSNNFEAPVLCPGGINVRHPPKKYAIFFFLCAFLLFRVTLSAKELWWKGA